VGRVQGVGFRFTVMNMAGRYPLTGYVRNVLDGTVEMVAQGHPDDIESCIQDIKGSYAHSNIEIRIEDVPLNPEYNEFKITF